MRRPDLVPDCGSCAAICCVAAPFDASEDFAFDKPAGVSCRHLRRDCRCAIHEQLIERGFPGCVVYDCYGAGQRATRAFADLPDPARQRNAAFLLLRVLHELIWQLTEAVKLCPSTHSELRARLAGEVDTLDTLASAPLSLLDDAQLGARRVAVDALLREVGAAVGGRRGLRALVVVS